MKKSNALLGWTCILFALLLSNLSHAQVIFVDQSATGANDGTSWSNAFTDLSDALAISAPGDAIWIADGVYKPTNGFDFDHSGDVVTLEVTFLIPDGVLVYGGFRGDEAAIDERDWETNLTILSGDIDNNDVNIDGNFIAETTGDIVDNNAFHVVAAINVSSPTRVDGVVITAGNAITKESTGSENLRGGGWYNLTRSFLAPDGPTVANTIFRGNFASGGGAIGDDEGSSGLIFRITNCKFYNNRAHTGGGIHSRAGGTSFLITECEFVGNRSVGSGGAILLSRGFLYAESSVFRENTSGLEPENSDARPRAGAVYLASSDALFIKCMFEHNQNVGDRIIAPIEGGGGGAVAITQGESFGRSQRFLQCGFYSNEVRGTATDAAWGGAVFVFTRNGMVSPTFTNCVFSRNSADGTGGAIASYMEHLGPFSPMPALNLKFTNCTFTENHAGTQGGAIYNNEFRTGSEVLIAHVENCILWGNTAGVEGDQIFNNVNNSRVSYSIIEGSGGSGATWNPAIGADEGHNMDIDPAFQNIADPQGIDGTPATNDDGLRLRISSAGLNSGNDAAAGLVGISTDYNGDARISGLHVDRGAYEHATPITTLPPWRCASCPWVMTLLPLDPIFMWDGVGTMAEADDGKATTITGKIVSSVNKSHTFDVYLKLVNAADWETWRKSNRTILTYTPEAAAIAKQTVDSWTFWELSGESYFKGTGSLTGLLTLQPYPSDFKVGWQFGPGANGWDKDAGVSGLFSYQGTLINKNKKQKVKGVGSLNVDAEWCEKCLPPKPNNILTSEGVEISSVKTDFIVFPTLAEKHVTIVSESLPADRYTVTLYDQNGQAKKALTLDSEMGDSVIPLDDLNSGPYVIRLVSSRGEVLTKKIVVK